MAKVISVNVGLPRDVPWRGKIVSTAIWKHPVDGRVFAGRLNLAGDGQADLVGHGGEQRAVMVYQIESYRYWSEFLGRSDFEPGQFGENFTVEGLPDGEVFIGDRYKIGTAVFEVTQPRVTCYRLGIRMNYEQMPALLVAHGRPGFYCRVIQEGSVGAGDVIEKLSEGPERMSVAEIDSLLYSAVHPLEALSRAVRISALSPGWLGSMNALRDAVLAGQGAGNAGLSAKPTAAPAWNGMRRLRIIATQRESEDVRSFDLEPDDGSDLPDASPGQYLTVRLRPRPGAPSVTRNYSLCGALGRGIYRIAVKREQGGVASGYLHERAKPGDTLEALAPRGSFVLEPEASPVVLISAGVGITPLLGMLHALLQMEKASSPEVWWIHSARDGTHHPFADEVRGVLAGLGRGRSIVFYTRPTANDQQAMQYDAKGRVDIALLQELGMPLSAIFYLCGPAAFMATMISGLRERGIPAGRVRTELFGPAAASSDGKVLPAPHRPDGEQGSGPIVTFIRSGISVHWDARFGSLLELAEACDVPVRWSCRAGVCHTCECGLIDGELEYSRGLLDRPAEGLALICCSTPKTGVDLDL
jgi:ferredoxin-NADP reductase/MOSC domain-containing protein YiiM/ferredoxin